MYCKFCGKVKSEESNVCSRCGKAEYADSVDIFTEETIERAKAGDNEAKTRLYYASVEPVIVSARAILKKDDESVKDIAQETYIKAFASLDQLSDPEKFPGWIKRIAANKSKNLLMKRSPMLFADMETEDGTEPEFEDVREENMPEIVMDRKETSRLVNEILDTLSDEQRLCITMFYYDRMSVRQIAQEIGCSENTIKTRLNLGRKKIKDKVLGLEKKGIKLYSMSGLTPIAFLIFLLKNLQKGASRKYGAGLWLKGILGEAGVAAATVTGGAGAAVTATAVKTGIAAWVKVIIGAAAAAVAIGTGAFIATRKPEPPQASAIVVEKKENEETEEIPVVEEIAAEQVEMIEEMIGEAPQKETIDPSPTAAPILKQEAVAKNQEQVKPTDEVQTTPAATQGTTSVPKTATPSTPSAPSTTSHTHSYSVTRNATCSSAGVKTCSCGATQSIPATGSHSWTNITENRSRVVHHDAVYTSVKVVEQPSWEEPVYEEQPVYETYGICVCSACGYEGSDDEMFDHIIGVHNNKASYSVQVRQRQIGMQQVQTGTIHHDEVSHMEQQLVSSAWDETVNETVVTGKKCSVCGITG